MFGVPTLFFLVYGSRAANAQAVAAKLQSDLVRVQLKEQLRPVLILQRDPEEGRFDVPEQRARLRNVGTGAAMNVHYIWSMDKRGGGTAQQGDGHPTQSRQTIPPSQTMSVHRPPSTWESDLTLKELRVDYQDGGGIKYATLFLFTWMEKGVEVSTMHFDS